MFHSPRLLRFILNVYPPYLGAGVHVDKIAADWKKIEVSMKLRWFNRNAVRTHFGGSLYSMVDPHLMLMLMQLMGKDYIVWDKSASIAFLQPGKGRVSARLEITDNDLDEIRIGLARKKRILPQFEVDIVDEWGKVVARVSKTLYVRRK
ncbi:MAG: DUF4442 domain-containing protein [Desulfopila sp.]